MRKSKHSLTSFSTTTIGERGQVVIPADIRKKLKIKRGEKFVVFLTHSKMVVFIPANRFRRLLSELGKKLSKLKSLI